MRAWEPQPGEKTGRNGGKPWACFQIFRDMMPPRSIKGAAARFYGKTAETLSASQYATARRWAGRFDWHGRVDAYDGWVEMTKNAAVEEHLRRQADEVGAIEAEIRRRDVELRLKMSKQSERILDTPLFSQTVTHEDEDGRPVAITFRPAGWTKGTAVSLAQAARGDSDVPADEPAELDLSELSEEELRTIVDLAGKLGVRRPE